MGCAGGVACGCMDSYPCIKPVGYPGEVVIPNVVEETYKRAFELAEEQCKKYQRDQEKLIMVCKALHINVDCLGLETYKKLWRLIRACLIMLI